MEVELEMANKDTFTESRVQQENEHLMKQHYSERDLFWQKQIDKIENDTLVLIDRWKNEKQYLSTVKTELDLKLKAKDHQQLSLKENIQGLQQ